MPAVILDRDESHLGYIDLNKKELRNAQLHQLGSDPGTPVNGQVLYRTDTHKIRARINGAWQDMATMADVTAGGISVAEFDAKGDLLVGTADDAMNNLPVGANGTILVAASGEATGLQWRTLTEADITLSATDRLVGRDTAAGGVAEEITVGGGIEFTGSGGIQRSAFTGGDVTGSAGSATLTIPDGTVTYAKMQDVSATDRLLGRDTAAAGDVEELTVGGGVEFTGSGGIQTSAFTGDVTKTAGGTSTTIANAAVSLAKMANLAANSIIGNNTGSAATPLALTTAQVKTLLALVAADISDFNTAVRTNSLDQMAAPTASVAWNSQKITGLLDGTAATDAINLGQLQAAIEGRQWKDPVSTATTGVLPNTPTYSAGAGTLTAGSNTTLAAQAGHTLLLNERILVKDQASTFQNGIYQISALGSGAAPWVLTRTLDASTAAELSNATVTVEASDSTLKGKTYTQQNTLADLTAAAQSYTITGDNNTYTDDGTTTQLTANAFSVRALGITNSHINASAAIAYSKLSLTGGIVNGDINASAAIAYSKLNLAASLVAGDVATGGTTRIARVVDGALTGGANSEVITHSLGKQFVQLNFFDNATPFAMVGPYYYECTSTTTATVYAASGNNLPAGFKWQAVG